MKIIKKSMSVLLSVLVLISMMAVAPTIVSAASFSPRTTAPDKNNAYYYSWNPFYTGGFGMPNCTCYAYGRAYEILGSKPALSTGMAGAWWSYNKNNKIYSYGSTPKLGAILCWDKYDNYNGHVAVVEKINGNDITISESHYGGAFFDTKVIKSDSSNYLTSMRFLGYIYIGNFDSHTHNFNTFVEYQSTHPHYAVYKCSCGEKQVNKNVTQYSSSCSACLSSLGAEQTITDGEYLITLAANPSYCLSVDGDKKEPSTNIHIWDSAKDDNYKSVVVVKHEGDGYYSLTFKNTGMAMDVKDYGKTNGTNVLQYYPTSNSNQRWVIKPTADKSAFNIISKCNGLYLDVYDGKAANGTNVQMYKGNGSEAQRWRFIASGLSIGQTISDGDYLVALNANQNYCLAVDGDKKEEGTNIHIWDSVKDDNYKSVVTVKYEGNGYYSLVFKNTGMAMGVKDYGRLKGTNVEQYYPNSNNNKRWIIKPTADKKSFYIVSKCNGLYLDVYNGTAANGTNVQMYLGNGSAAQKWRFVASGLSTGQTLSDGKYKIVSALDNNLALDVKGGEGENEAAIQVYNRPMSEMSDFNVKYKGNGYYYIEYTKTNRRLDVVNNYTYKGVPIQLYDQNTYSAQQWILKDTGDGYYNIVSKGSGLYLDIYNALTTDENPVLGWIGNGTAAQKWKFVKSTTPTVPTEPYDNTQQPEPSSQTTEPTLATEPNQATEPTSVTDATQATESTQPTTPAASISKTKESVMAGGTVTLKVNNGTVKTWSTSNKAVATVSKGKVTGLKKGSATITATLTTGKKFTCKVTVTTSPKLSKKSITVKKGKTVSVKITGKASTVKNVYTNTKIAKITSKNTATTVKIKGLKKGLTTLKIKVNGVVLKLKVKVK